MNDFEQIKEEIKTRVTIVDLISHYVSLKQNGANYVGLCPFHNEKTPSFNVSLEKGIFKCFGCGKAGDLFTFIMEKENYSFIEAMNHLSQMAGIKIEKKGNMTPEQKLKFQYYDLNKRLTASFSNILLNKPEARKALDYLLHRGLSLEIIEEYQLGYLPDQGQWLWEFLKKRNYSKEFLAGSGLFSKKNPQFSLFTGRLVFPIKDRLGRVVAFSGRQMKDFGPKYINSPETNIFHKGDTLYGIDKAGAEIRRKESVFLVEGNFDVLSMHQSGVLNCIAPLGTAFTESQARVLQKHAKKAWCLFDSDPAGLKAAEKASLLLLRLGIAPYIIELPQGSDPSDILKKDGPQALQNISKYSINSFDYLLKKAVDQFGIDNIEKKEQVIKVMLPYIQLFKTEIRKNDAIRGLAEVVGLDFISLQKDLMGDQFRLKTVNKLESKTQKRVTTLLGKEMMLLLTASLNIEYFIKVRSEFKLKNFHIEEAKELFIALEDCYRHQRFQPESIIEALESEELKHKMQYWMTHADFIQDRERSLEDSITSVKLKDLKVKKIELQGQLRGQNYESFVDNNVINDILGEIQTISEEIKKLKG